MSMIIKYVTFGGGKKIHKVEECLREIDKPGEITLLLNIVTGFKTKCGRRVSVEKSTMYTSIDLSWVECSICCKK